MRILKKAVKGLPKNWFWLLTFDFWPLTFDFWLSSYTKRIPKCLLISLKISVSRNGLRKKSSQPVETGHNQYRNDGLDEKAVLLMMKWGYEGSKAFIGGNPVKKIINSSREIREILSVDLNACNNYKTGKDSLKKISCPTLCIFGDLDKMVPLKVGNNMSELIKNSKTKVIQNCGHMIIFEKAFEMRKLVKEFLIENKKWKNILLQNQED